MADEIDTSGGGAQTGSTLLSGDEGKVAEAGAAAAEAKAAAEEKPAEAAAETPEAKTAREAAEAEAKAAEVPEAYQFEMPEGVELDTAAVEEFSAIAKELKLSQADAQKVAEVGAKMVQRQREQHATLVASWEKAVREDAEIGGDSAKENTAIGRKAVETFGTPELKKFLLESGLGNHPELVRAFVKVGKATKQDGFLRGGSTTRSETDPAAKMFPTMQQG